MGSKGTSEKPPRSGASTRTGWSTDCSPEQSGLNVGESILYEVECTVSGWPGSARVLSSLFERAEQELRCQAVGCDAVASGHIAGGEERVQDGFLRGLRSRLEERRCVGIRHHLQGHDHRWCRESGARDAAVARGEGEEDVAAPIVEATPHPAEADARTHRDTVALSRQERRVGGQHHDYGTGPRRPGLRLVLERRRDELGTKHT